MPDETPVAPTPASPAAPAPEPGPTINIGEEFGTAKRNLPPAKIVAIALGIILVIAAIVVFSTSRPTSAGSIDEVTGVEIPNQNSVMAVINVTLQNSGQKAFWIHTMKATLKTDSGEFTDEAASPADFDRYFQAFPALKQHALAALKVETKVGPGAQATGTIIVTFPVTQDAFDKRKSLTVTVQPYDERAVVITK